MNAPQHSQGFAEISRLLGVFKELSKSGIVVLVLLSVTCGFFIGHPLERPLDWVRFFETLLGILLLSSGSAALNQFQERYEDSLMPRTASRPLPSGRITQAQALTFSVVLIAGGLLLLGVLSATLLVLGALAALFYNGLYTLWWKRKWAFAAVPGAIPGALPVLMGHFSASGDLTDPGGLFLFFLLFFWQMPHFWVLALKYSSDYAKGGFPTLPVQHGRGITVHQIILWCLAYVGVAFLAPFFLKVQWIYFAITLGFSAKVLYELRCFARNPESKYWLRFFLWVNFSLIAYLAAAVLDLWSVYLQPFILF